MDASDRPQDAGPIEAERCAYAAETLADLRRLGTGPRWRLLNYMLDQARVEAERMAREPEEDHLR